MARRVDPGGRLLRVCMILMIQSCELLSDFLAPQNYKKQLVYTKRKLRSIIVKINYDCALFILRQLFHIESN